MRIFRGLREGSFMKLKGLGERVLVVLEEVAGNTKRVPGVFERVKSSKEHDL